MENNLVSKFIQKMITISEGNTHDISHFLKVYSFAKTIGELEGLDFKTELILELSAICHDISCPLCRMKYGNTNGIYQEKESKDLLIPFLKDFDLEEDIKERIIYLVSHHHTYTNVLGLDYQILLEADYLVNACESGYDKNSILEFKKNVFKTKSGISLLDAIYLR